MTGRTVLPVGADTRLPEMADALARRLSSAR
jgi:hypothetical protein